MENDFTVRWSKEEDRISIQNLLYDSFGFMVENEGAYDGIGDGRYLVLVTKDGTIAALTGFQHHSDYPDIEITWTTTDKRFRHKGYMQELFKRLLQTTDQPVYCCCWRVADADRVNLQTLMNMFGFKEVIHGMNKYRSEYICPGRKGCPYWCKYKEDCYCAKDLYLRDIKGEENK